MSSQSSFSRRAIRILVRRLPALFLAAAWPFWALVILLLVARVIVRQMVPPDAVYDPITEWQEMSALVKCGVIIAFVASASLPRGLAMAGVSLVAYQEYVGSKGSTWTVLKQIRIHVLSLLTLSFLLGFLTLLGSGFIVGGVLVEAWTIFAVHLLLLQDCGIAAAVRGSVQLAGQRIGTILTLILSLTTIVTVVEVF